MTHSADLRSLLTPKSVALVGASGKAGSIGRIALENLLADRFHGQLYAVNPGHRSVLDQRAYTSVKAIGAPVDLAVIAVPSAAIAVALEESASAGVHAAAILSPLPTDPEAARETRERCGEIAKAHGIRVIGPESFGIVRTDIGLNATLGTSIARAGRLALIAQSGAVCAAMLDFAHSGGIGFSSVIALGSTCETGIGELLDALLADASTDAILLHAESIREPRRFLSALRAAARTKPVAILKAGRSMEARVSGEPAHDAVFDAAMRRAGTVRVDTYTQLFAAARILALGRYADGDRLAIVTNGRGPGVLAADRAADLAIPLAELGTSTQERLAALLSNGSRRPNPIDVRADAAPARLAAAVEAVLDDENVDAVLALHVTRPSTSATDAARAVAEVAQRTHKLVLGAWLGSVDRREIDAALEAGHVTNFYTPENAVEAFSLLAGYRRHQQWLLEVPSSQPEPRPLDLAAVERVRASIAAKRLSRLDRAQTQVALDAFDLPLAPAIDVDTLDDARAAARRLGYPVALRQGASSSPAIERLRDGRMLARAWTTLGIDPGARRAGAVVYKPGAFATCRDLTIGIHTDRVFGPVITVGSGGTAGAAVMLPPLNDRLARELVDHTRAAAVLEGLDDAAGSRDALVRILVQLSALACALPWVRSLVLDPVRIGAGRAEIGDARIVADPDHAPAGRPYAHMAIHPYPIELIEDVTLGDGTPLHLRPIRPEDAELERAFVQGLSEQSRYFRFFYQLHELTLAMLARFTQIDYDREMALVAVDASGATPAIIGVARYVIELDPETAEFAIVVADAWHGRGVARLLMARLVRCAKARGLDRLEGSVLRGNQAMLRFTSAFGFETRDQPDDQEQVTVSLALR